MPPAHRGERELLETLGLDFAVVPAKGEEIARGAGPAETVEALSRAKAEEVAKDFPNALIIAADTVVWAGGRILGKPKDETDAKPCCTCCRITRTRCTPA